MEFPLWNEFYKKYKNDPEKCRRECFEIGRRAGRNVMARLNLKGDDPDTLAKVVNAFMREVKSESAAKVEDGRVIFKNRSFCPIMISARTFNQPWLWLDENVAWPIVQGIASAVNPQTEHRVTSARARGDLVCEHVFDITR